MCFLFYFCFCFEDYRKKEEEEEESDDDKEVAAAAEEEEEGKALRFSQLFSFDNELFNASSAEFRRQG